jgi:hypothetical protein
MATTLEYDSNTELLNKHGEYCSPEQIEDLAQNIYVHRESPNERRKFIRNVVYICTLMILFSFTTSLFVLLYGSMEFMFNNPILIIFEAISFLMIVTLYSLKIFNVKQLHHQIISSLFVLSIFTIFVCIISSFSSLELFIQIYAATLSLLFSYCIYYSQNRVKLNKLVLVIYSLVVLAIVSYMFVFLPNKDFFTHPSFSWFHPREAIILQLAAIGYSLIFMIQIVWHTDKTMYCHTKHQYVYVGCMIYINVVLLLTIIFQQMFRVDSSKSEPYKQFDTWKNKFSNKA